MVRPREYKSGQLTNVPLMLDRELMDEFANTLPRHKSVSKAVREYMKSVVDEQKKVIALSENRSAIKITNFYGNTDTQTTLDKHFPYWIQNYKDWKLQNEIQDSLTY